MMQKSGLGPCRVSHRFCMGREVFASAVKDVWRVRWDKNVFHEYVRRTSHELAGTSWCILVSHTAMCLVNVLCALKTPLEKDRGAFPGQRCIVGSVGRRFHIVAERLRCIRIHMDVGLLPMLCSRSA